MDDFKVNLENLTQEEREQLLALVKKGNTDNKRWKPTKDKLYYFVDSSGIVEFVCFNSDFDERCYDIGNCFKTREEAEFKAECIKVQHEIEELAREYNDGWKPDIYDICEYKYFIYYDGDDGIICDYCIKWADLPFTMFFKSEELCQKAIDTIGRERLLKYWFRVKE